MLGDTMSIIVLRSPDELQCFPCHDPPHYVQFVVAVNDTPANLAVVAATINDRRVQVLGLGGIDEDPLTVAVIWAAHRTIHETRDPSWWPVFYELTELKAHEDEETWFTAVEVEMLLNHGVTPVYPRKPARIPGMPINDEVRVVVPRSITSYHMNEQGEPDFRWLDTCFKAKP